MQTETQDPKPETRPAAMPPLDRAKRVYLADPQCTRSFESDLTWYLRHGYVFSTPEFFIMGVARGDAWFIHVAAASQSTVDAGQEAGDTRHALRYFLNSTPYPLPFIEWHRRGGSHRRYPLKTIERHLNHGLDQR